MFFGHLSVSMSHLQVDQFDLVENESVGSRVVKRFPPRLLKLESTRVYVHLFDRAQKFFDEHVASNTPEIFNLKC